MIKQSDVDFLYETFQEFIEQDTQLLLLNFSQRFQLAVEMEVGFSNERPNDYNNTHAKTIKLSELWFCFELLSAAADYGFGNIKEKSDEQKNKEWLNSQRISAIGTIEPEKPKKQNPFVNVDYTYQPFGKARLLNERYFSGKWFTYTYDEVLDAFSLINTTLTISQNTIRESLAHYLKGISSHAQGEQETFLARGYNALMGNSGKEIKSHDILSFIYAVRCSYVHQGELPDSYNMPVAYKEFVVDECIKFLVSYCSLAYSSVIDELYLA